MVAFWPTDIADLASELVLLRKQINDLGIQINSMPVSYGNPRENNRQPVPDPTDNGTRSDSGDDAQQWLLQEQEALYRLNDYNLTMEEFMASSEFTELPPMVQNRVMQEVVRRFNSGEINRERFLPGYSR